MAIKIICGDNVEEMRKLQDESVDLIITSPPYDDIRDYYGFSFDIDSIVEESYRLLTKGGMICWVTADQIKDWTASGTSFRTALKFMEKFNLYQTIIYEKKGVQKPDQNRYFRCWEYIFCFSKGKPRVFNPIEDRKNNWAGTTCWGKQTTRQKNGDLKETKRKVIPEYSKRRNIFTYAVGKGNTTKDEIGFKHPAMFPEKLVEDLIYSFSNEGDNVMDIFNGAGTTTKVAQYMERNAIGIEISQEYCDIAEKRLFKEIDVFEF